MEGGVRPALVCATYYDAAGDIDPNHLGMEVWSFDGLNLAPTNRLAESNTSPRPCPQMGLWWDGDITMEPFNSGKIEKWDPDNPTPTDRPSNTRLHTLAHNPAHRNDMTVKGYMRSHHADYSLGAGMIPPPRPDITCSGR